MSAPLVQLSGIRKSYGSATDLEVEVLHGIDLALAPGEFTALIGPSGSGKSTLLNLIGLLEPPSGGSYVLGGRETAKLSEDDVTALRATQIGFVFQFHHLLPEFSALENAMMPALIQGWDRNRAAAAATAILARVGLQARLDYRVGKLSGGEQQRVALARALVLRPPLLLTDEPTGNLDRANSEQVHRLLLELNAEIGMTLVAVTHNLELAACLSRRVTLREGRLSPVS